MPLKNELASRVAKALNDAGLSIRSYSGRGMYGKSCLGVSASLWAVATALSAEMDEWSSSTLMDDVAEPNTDSLGLGSIVYWPGLPWNDSFTSEADDDEEEE